MVKIGNQSIGRGFPPFIVAEMSGNHNQSLDQALEIVEAAAKAGAHALKLQTYTPDTITLDCDRSDFIVKNSDGRFKGEKLYDLYRKARTPWEWHEEIFKKSAKLGLTCFSAPFDETAVDFLESLDCPAYKIASPEIIHLPLIRKAAATGKPIIMSTGMASVAELDEAVKEVRETGNESIILLKCTSCYPASPENMNLLTIPHMRQLFQCEVGLSDHTMGIGAALASISLGAVMIEKHFTCLRSGGGVDASFSLETEEMKTLVAESRNAWQSLGNVHYGPAGPEENALPFRRSIYVAEDIRKGEVFTEKNVRVVRPGYGLRPKFFHQVLGRKALKDLQKGTPMRWELMTEPEETPILCRTVEASSGKGGRHGLGCD